MLSRLFVALLFCFSSLLSFAQDFYYQGSKPALIIDVRTPEEFAAGHIPGAVNIPYEKIVAGISQVKGVEKSQAVLVYCRSGRRSSIAKASLEQNGWKQVVNGGGIEELAKNLKQCSSKTC